MNARMYVGYDSKLAYCYSEHLFILIYFCRNNLVECRRQVCKDNSLFVLFSVYIWQNCVLFDRFSEEKKIFKSKSIF